MAKGTTEKRGAKLNQQQRQEASEILAYASDEDRLSEAIFSLIDERDRSLTPASVPSMEKSTIEKTLPELVSGFVKGVMENPANLTQYARDLQLWNDAQPLENRQQLTMDTTKLIDTARLSLEWLLGEYRKMFGIW